VNAAVVSALISAELLKTFEDRDIMPGGDTPDEFGRFIQDEVGKWRELAARIGIKPE
jgi:tripartite-type tricarboxylate transporter receptor subunit TctC